MGRGGFKRNRGGNNRGRGGGGRSSERKSYPELVKENEKLQQYYDGLLGLGDDEEERAAFWAAFRRELPHSFRFCGSKGHAVAVQKLLQTRYIPDLAKIEQYEGTPVRPPQPVPWYPDNLAWWMATSKTVIRKSPPFAAFQKFLVSETTVGNISRQEVVSMIPPLLMDVRPGMAVLDLCAAPGSKAAQLLEMIHQGEEARVRKVMRSIEKSLDGGAAEEMATEEGGDEDDEEDPAARLSADASDDGRATGVLVANDADYKRSHLLIHQLKRLSSPNIIVTNHDATIYPSLRLPPLPVTHEVSNGGTNKKREPVRYLKFDRILADVPCSGDGTLRKNVNMWKEWNPGNALGLHLVQVRILVRALQMLKPGGRVVYSTCSLNPVENESVVASAIALCGGASKVDILDSSDQLPLLQRRPGLKAWQIMDKAGRLWGSWAEVEAFVASEAADGTGLPPSRVVPTMFANEASDKLPLERCLRVYPHLQDTGGFFIVVLQKKAEFKAKTVPTGAPAPKKQQQEQQTSAPGEAAEEVESTAENGPSNEAGEEDAAAAGTKRPAEDDVASQDSQPVKKQKPDAEVKEELDEPEDEAAAEETEEAVATGNENGDTDADASNDINDVNSNDAGPRRKIGGPYEEPFKYLAADHPVVRGIQEFYQLSPRFPSDRFLVRNAYGEPAKAIYYTSGLVRDILVSNTSGDGPQQQGNSGGRGVKFVHGGVRMFVKQEAPSAEVCRWRIQAEGLPLLSGYVGEARVVRLHSRATLKALLVEMFPKFADGEWRRLGEVGAQLPALGMGCFVLKVEPRDDEEELKEGVDVPLEPMTLPLWKSFHSLNLMLPKEDRAAMLLRIYNDTTPLINSTLQDKGKKGKENGAAANGEQQQQPRLTIETAPTDEDVTMADASGAKDAASSAAPDEASDVKAGGGDGETNEINDYDAEDAPSS